MAACRHFALFIILGAVTLSAPAIAANTPEASPVPESEADISQGLGADGECDASDEECAMSMRQFRGESLAPDGVDEVSASAQEAALLQRPAAEREGLFPVSLAQSLTGKGVIGYHQTSIDLCHKIVQTGFRPGGSGWCGGAIYFSSTMRGTFGEAVGYHSHQGCVISAKLDMGKVKRMPRSCDTSMTGGKLRAMGYDSIAFNDGAGTGTQYVVYDPSRVHGAHIVWTSKRHENHWEEHGARYGAMPNESTNTTNVTSLDDNTSS